MADFGLLDEAFGNDSVPAGEKDKVIVVLGTGRRKRAAERSEDVVEMCEVKIEMTVQDGPRSSLPSNYPCNTP